MTIICTKNQIVGVTIFKNVTGIFLKLQTQCKPKTEYNATGYEIMKMTAINFVWSVNIIHDAHYWYLIQESWRDNYIVLDLHCTVKIDKVLTEKTHIMSWVAGYKRHGLPAGVWHFLSFFLLMSAVDFRTS